MTRSGEAISTVRAGNHADAEFRRLAGAPLPTDIDPSVKVAVSRESFEGFRKYVTESEITFGGADLGPYGEEARALAAEHVKGHETAEVFPWLQLDGGKYEVDMGDLERAALADIERNYPDRIGGA